MSYKNIEGKSCILIEANDANIPVNSFMLPPDEESKKWRWIADNFMPRKCRVEEGAYGIEAKTQEEILQAVREHVVPIYEAALTNLKARGENYYWEAKP